MGLEIPIGRVPALFRGGSVPTQAREAAAIEAAREDNPAAALELYRSLDPRELLHDEERLTWIFRQLRHTLDPRFEPMAQIVASEGRGVGQRRALHFLASRAYYDGNRPAAAELWQRALELGRSVRDRLWVSGVANLGLIYGARGRSFESLVLSGMAFRAAQAGCCKYSAAHTAARLGAQLTELLALDEAEAAFLFAEEIAPSVSDSDRKNAVLLAIAKGRSSLHRARGDYSAALVEQERHVELCEELPPHRLAQLVGAQCGRIDLIYRAFPERRGEALAELEQIPERYPLGEQFHWLWLNDLLPLRLDYLIEVEGNIAKALEVARELYALLERREDDLELMERASELGRIFAERLHAPARSAAAYKLAATAALRRLLEINRSSHELPELAEATRKDWEILQRHRQRLLSLHSSLSDAIRELWRKGHPAVDLVLDDNGFIRACGWCQRIQSRDDGSWLHVSQYLPPAGELQITHGICHDCREALMEEQ